MEEPTDFDGIYAKVKAMRVSEIKAELDLRKISYVGLFEKEELARALAESRAEGRADPEILDRFNREKMERMMDENAPPVAGAGNGEADVSLDDAVAGDGSLPGGMSPEKLSELMNNPEMMALLSNPRLQDVMKQVMEKGPAGVDPSMMSDPETREVLEKLQGILGK
jgi:hypothetical protein